MSLLFLILGLLSIVIGVFGYQKACSGIKATWEWFGDRLTDPGFLALTTLCSWIPLSFEWAWVGHHFSEAWWIIWFHVVHFALVIASFVLLCCLADDF